MTGRALVAWRRCRRGSCCARAWSGSGQSRWRSSRWPTGCSRITTRGCCGWSPRTCCSWLVRTRQGSGSTSSTSPTAPAACSRHWRCTCGSATSSGSAATSAVGGSRSRMAPSRPSGGASRASRRCTPSRSEPRPPSTRATYLLRADCSTAARDTFRIGDSVRLFFEAEARVLQAEGRPDEALAVLELAEPQMLVVRNPVWRPWRSQRASRAARPGPHRRGAGPAREELALAEEWGTPGLVGRTWRIRGEIEGASGEQSLHTAVEHLARSPLRLELARAQAALGGLLNATATTEACDLLSVRPGARRRVRRRRAVVRHRPAAAGGWRRRTGGAEPEHPAHRHRAAHRRHDRTGPPRARDRPGTVHHHSHRHHDHRLRHAPPRRRLRRRPAPRRVRAPSCRDFEARSARDLNHRDRRAPVEPSTPMFPNGG